MEVAFVIVAFPPRRFVRDAFVAKKFVEVALVLVAFTETRPLVVVSPVIVREPVTVVDETSSTAPVIDPPVNEESVIVPFVNVELVILLSVMELSLISPRNERSPATSSMRL